MAGYRAFVIAKDGTRLMPTTNPKFVRHVLNAGLAHVVSKNPYTIQLDYETKTKETQPIEACEDTGAEHIGLSVKSETHEYVSEQRDLLPNEKERHDDRRKYRRGRRNRKRYRKPRF